MTPKDLVHSYLPFVDFLAEALGPTAEIVLHDLRQEEHSMIAIRNPLTGRRAGDATATEEVHHMTRRAEKTGRPFITNYFSKPTGECILRSSTYFIRDDEGRIAGILGLNIDLTDLWAARDTVDRLLTLGNEVHLEAEGKESTQSQDASSPAELSAASHKGWETSGIGGAGGENVEKMVYAVLKQILASCPSEPKRLTAREKRELVETLNDRGVFLLKGVVTEVARRLAVSEQTIYRYIKGQ
ncbi:MAG: hypothetical protein GX256_10405 [Fretibacterium sp.]|nr:hypothetical protein [Fretibacterium sp.]